jgi:hypothetical protein
LRGNEVDFGEINDLNRLSQGSRQGGLERLGRIEVWIIEEAASHRFAQQQHAFPFRLWWDGLDIGPETPLIAQSRRALVPLSAGLPYPNAPRLRAGCVSCRQAEKPEAFHEKDRALAAAAAQEARHLICH